MLTNMTGARSFILNLMRQENDQEQAISDAQS
jgi:hypothetical protein